MQIDHAPMEGLTDYLYRQVFDRHFGGIDTYYTPFLSPTQTHTFTSRQRNEIEPAHNEGLHVIPQLLTNSAEHCLWACNELKAMGYGEINLNMGCPSGTVVAKHKGSGMLTDLTSLQSFLEELFARADGLRISVKCRVGVQEEAEWEKILPVLSAYPFSELIIHPRLQRDLYRGAVHAALFDAAAAQYKGALTYNGDIFTPADAQRVAEKYPRLHGIMLARGIIANPALALEIRGTGTRDIARLEAFHADLYEACARRLPGDTPLLNHMKEVWFYQLPLFADCEIYAKMLRKAKNRADYEQFVSRLFRTAELLPDGGYRAVYK